MTHDDHRGGRKVLFALIALNLIAFLIPPLVGNGTLGWSSEGGPTTFAAAASLLVTAWYGWKVHALRRRPVGQATGPVPALRDPAAIWALMSLGFLFLAVDDVLRIHELTDHAIHTVLGWEETDASDQLDDLIIGGYLVIGVIVMGFYRNEIAAMWRPLALFAPGVLATLVMIACDWITNRRVFLEDRFPGETAAFLFEFLSATEEFAKNGGALLFAVAMIRAWREAAARQPTASSQAGPL
ncbi:hypothetical protein [Chthonobacter albigriseus]|uniref:hypothetical protein n=1 Tax=Chthonobacter albigriseus TaxID=1683161 RepID=UPI0015EECF53|nr:hypothetical protein [Chthonobacter albigriseus]